MTLYTWVAGDRPDWIPLERFAEVTARLHDGRLQPGDFMYMGRVRARGLADIHLYKHIGTRRYINLDDASHAHRFLGVVGDSLLPSARSHYERWREARSAIEHVRPDLLDDMEWFTGQS
jgi:hypothetical protein